MEVLLERKGKTAIHAGHQAEMWRLGRADVDPFSYVQRRVKLRMDRRIELRT